MKKKKKKTKLDPGVNSKQIFKKSVNKITKEHKSKSLSLPRRYHETHVPEVKK